MVEPIYPVLYWRDFATRTADQTTYDTLEKLITLKPLQVIEFEKSGDNSAIVTVAKGGTGNIVDEPLYNPSGVKTIEKQQVGAISEYHTVNIKLPKAEWTKAKKLESFYRKPNKEKEYHTYGIMGIWFPATETVAVNDIDLISPNIFKISPTNVIGLTLQPPIFTYGVNESGADYMNIDLTYSLGGKNLTWVLSHSLRQHTN